MAAVERAKRSLQVEKQRKDAEEKEKQRRAAEVGWQCMQGGGLCLNIVLHSRADQGW